MELVERIPLDRIHYLNSLNFKQCKELDLYKSCKNDEERKIQFNIMKSFCETNIKTRGETKRIYSFTEKTPLEVGGRLYCGNSIQGLSSKLRGFLLGNTTTDIDMKNAHPVILKYLCFLHNIECPNLSYYVHNRNDILNRLGSEYKTEFLKAVNNDQINKKSKDDFFKAFDKECKNIQKIITSLDCYKYIVSSVPSTREYNWLGSAINRILCVFENKIIQEVVSVLNSKQIEICAMMFDGIMAYGNYYDNIDLLENIQTFVENKFQGLKMVFSFKEHSNFIQMPNDFKIKNNDEKILDVLDKSFYNISTEFEKFHCKITNKSLFIKTTENNNIIMSRNQIKASYEHMIYEEYNPEGGVYEKNFIDSWLINNPKQKYYDDIGVYPTGLICPKNIFNMWRPFSMELINEYTYKNDELQIILNHIKILCGNDDNITDYFIKWIAQMIQFPAIKSICPTFISNQGAGKGTLLRLFEKMLGSSKVFETTNPSRDIWGDFNGRMASTFLINLNELSKKETIESEGRIKGLISDPVLTINNKGTNQYDIQSFHRFIITTNKQEPINTTADDRRNVIINSSNEKCGDKLYFNNLYEILDDINVVKTCYEYFKSIPDMDKFNSIPIPVTEYHKQLKELSINPIEKWLHDFTNKNESRDYVELNSQSILEKFNDWCSENGIEYKCNSIQLMVRITRLMIDGIEKHHTKTGNKTRFDIEKMKKHFGIGCLL